MTPRAEVFKQECVQFGQIVKKYIISVNNLCFGGRSANNVLEYRYNAAKMCLYWSCSKFKTYTYLSFLGHKVDKLAE